MKRLKIFHLFVWGLLRACIYRSFQRKSPMPKLPNVARDLRLTHQETMDLGYKMKKVVDWLFFWHPGACYYRCFTILYVMRNMGVSVELNFGIVDPFAKKLKAMGAHCWMTLDGELFLENDRVKEKYPTKAADVKNGVTYWWGNQHKDGDE